MWAMCLKEFGVGEETVTPDIPATLAGEGESSLSLSLLLKLRDRLFATVGDRIRKVNSIPLSMKLERRTQRCYCGLDAGGYLTREHF